MFCLLRVLFIILNQARNHLFYITVDYIVGDCVDRCIRVVVDRNHNRAFLHTSDVLNLTRDTASDIKLWTYSHTCLTDLTFVFAIASIHRCTRSTNFCAKCVSQFIEHVEAFLASHTITTCYHDSRILDVDL